MVPNPPSFEELEQLQAKQIEESVEEEERILSEVVQGLGATLTTEQKCTEWMNSGALEAPFWIGYSVQAKWVNAHWRTIQSAYGKAPFFDFYANYFRETIYSNSPKLIDYNQQILTICLKLLKLSPKLSYSDNYIENAPEGYMDCRSVIHPKKNKGNLADFQPKSYTQIFGKGFVPDLSIIDLLFCEGPNALEVIRASSQN